MNQEIEEKLKYLEGKLTHLHIRSELTLRIISGFVAAGVVKKEGVLDLIKDANLDAFESPFIAEKEKEIVTNIINSIQIV